MNLVKLITATCTAGLVTLTIGVTPARATMKRACASHATASAITAPTIKVMTLNLAHGRKSAFSQLLVSRAQTYRNLDEVAALINRSGADIVALQEIDGPSRWSGSFDHAQHLLDNSGYGCVFHGYHAESWLYNYGTALLSSTRFDSGASLRFAPSPPTTTKGFVVSTVQWQRDRETVPVTFVSAHLDFSRASVRRSQVEAMIDVLSEVLNPIIVMGDFNGEWPESDSPIRQLAAGLGLQAHRQDHDGLGTYKSIDGARLDWVLISSELEFAEHRVLPEVVSDHHGVYAEIRWIQDHPPHAR